MLKNCYKKRSSLSGFKELTTNTVSWAFKSDDYNTLARKAKSFTTRLRATQMEKHSIIQEATQVLHLETGIMSIFTTQTKS